MIDYIDFVDSNSIRGHLRRRPPLPPAMQCILIAQSACRSPEDKLACNDLDSAGVVDLCGFVSPCGSQRSRRGAPLIVAKLSRVAI